MRGQRNIIAKNLANALGWYWAQAVGLTDGTVQPAGWFPHASNPAGAYRCLILQVLGKGSNVTVLLQGPAAFYCARRRQ
jgi:hypothetical protein